MENKLASYLGTQFNTIRFPRDVYSKAQLISFEVAKLPPSQFSKVQTPQTGIRFLFGGVVKTAQGANELVRKWTDWTTLSFHPKSKLSKIFVGVTDLQQLLGKYENADSQCWNRVYNIFVEASKNEIYDNISKVKSTTDVVTEPIFYTGVTQLGDGTTSYAPPLYVNYFGHMIPLSLSVQRRKEGIVQFSADELIGNEKLPGEDTPF